MLYGNSSISHYTRSNIAIWMSMAFQAGFLNIGGLLSCNSFVSHVTGFATLFSQEVERNNLKDALIFLSVPIFFIIGAMISAFLIDLKLKSHQKPKYFLSFGVIFFLNLVVFIGGVTDIFGPFGKSVDSFRLYILLSILCLICGIQNGIITTVSKSVIRTTHLTGITTDLGIGIVRVLFSDDHSNSHSNEKKANLMRIGIILNFGLGSLFGAYLFNSFRYYGFIAPVIISGTLFFTMLYFQSKKIKE